MTDPNNTNRVLTNAEIHDLGLRTLQSVWPDSEFKFARAIEAAVLAKIDSNQDSELRKSVEYILKNFKASESQGYRSRDRQFAIEILGYALDGGYAPIGPEHDPTTYCVVRGADYAIKPIKNTNEMP